MTGLMILNEKSDQHKRQKYATVNPKYIPASKYRDSTANELTASVLRWLDLHGHYCSRIQSQGQYRADIGRWVPGTTRKGIGDIMAIIQGRTIMIEIKVGRDKQSEKQIETQQDIEQSGGVYLIVRTFDDFYLWYMTFLNNNK